MDGAHEQAELLADMVEIAHCEAGEWDAAFVKTRDRTCRAPRCRTPAQKADIDHTRQWSAGGPTVYKGSKGVSLVQLAPGVFVWRTRLGHTYTVGDYHGEPTYQGTRTTSP